MRTALRRFHILVAALVACTCDPARTPPSAALAARALSIAPAPAPLDAADGGLLARKLPRIEYRGGPFLRHPQLVTITFANDEPQLVSRLEQFGDTITRSNWWHAVVGGYCSKPGVCIGDGRAGTPVHIAETLPSDVSDADIDALLHRTAEAGRLGPLDDDALLLVYLPNGVQLSDATTHYCTGHARAFHRSLDLAGQRVALAVLPRCGDEAQLTASASHEILEATTNPFPAQRGFAFVPGSAPSGFSAAGLEPVDPCGLITMDGHATTESGFVVHRAWSNRAAAQAQDPCVPSRPDRPYVMLVPREPAVRLAHEGDTATVMLDASTAGPDEDVGGLRVRPERLPRPRSVPGPRARQVHGERGREREAHDHGAQEAPLATRDHGRRLDARRPLSHVAATRDDALK